MATTKAAAIMTAGILAKPGNTCICGNCKGKGFDKRPGRAGWCQRCRGKGYTEVGRTKR